MSNAVATISLSDIERMAMYAAKSGLFGMRTVEQAAALMLVCQARGIHPMLAVEQFHIIGGRAVKRAEQVLADFQTSGGRVEWKELTDQRAEATFSHPQGGTLTIAWDVEMAKKAGLYGKDNWKGYPRAMLRSRVVAEGVRSIYPAAIGSSLTPEEAIDLPAEMGTAPRDVTPKPMTGVAALTARVAELANPPDAEVETATDAPLPEDSEPPVEPAYSYAQVADAFAKAVDGDTFNAAIEIAKEWESELPDDSPQRGEMREIAKATRRRINRPEAAA